MQKMTDIEFYGEASSDSEDLSEDEIWNPWVPNLVRVVFFKNESKSHVLMTKETGRWDFPWFTYKAGLEEGYRSTRICRDFAKWIGQPLQFVYVVELIGISPVWDGEMQWCHKVVVVETADTDETPFNELPSEPETQWQNCEFLNDLIDGITEDEPSEWTPCREDALRAALVYSRQELSFRLSLLEPRLLLGWFRKAREFLVSTIEREGDTLQGSVVQSQSTMASTVLIAKTQRGKQFFLKAPASGSEEMNITECVAKVLSKYTAEFVSSNLELGCFITKELKVGDADLEDAVMTLGRMQVDSISHLTQLKVAGCPVLDLNSIRRQLVKWLSGYHSSTSRALIQCDEYNGWYIMYLCKKLETVRLPLRLVHGDFTISNVGTVEHSDRTRIFDWEFACISHPFLDFYRFADRSHKIADISQNLIEKYLGLWTDYAPIEVLKEGLDIGSVLGRMLRVCSLWKRADACTHQLFRSSLDQWKNFDTRVLYDRAIHLKENDVEYWKSDEGEMESRMLMDSST